MKCCFNCLKNDLEITECTSKITCYASGCKKKHHTSLHDHYTNPSKNDSDGTKRDVKSSDGKDGKDGFNGLMLETIRDVFLQVVPVNLCSEDGKSVQTYALLDTGSQLTLLRADIAKKLSLSGKKLKMGISTIKDKAEKLQVEKVKVEVCSRDGSRRLDIESVMVVPADKFQMPSQRCPADFHNGDIYTHLDDINLETINPNDISILIGANAPDALLPEEVRRGRDDQPLAIKTMFGWTLFGASKSTKDVTNHSVGLLKVASNELSSAMESFWGAEQFTCNLVHSNDQRLFSTLEKFWIQEHCAILPAKDTAMSKEDLSALKKLEDSTKMVDGHYEVPMLWKDPDSTLPNNRFTAEKRFLFLEKRLRSHPELYEQYNGTMKDYMQKGYSRMLTPVEEKQTTPRTWYLPHHPVFNVNKPGKMRVVFDAASKSSGTSLNDSLVTGPDLLNSLVGVLMRFRLEKIAIVADIEAMFHQVLVPKSDADSLRFLWKEDIFSDDPPITMQMLVHIFGATDSATAANFAMKKTGRDNHKSFSSAAFETFLKSFYMDDLLKSVRSIEAAIILVKELIGMAKTSGFKLTKFVSNTKAVLEALPASEVSSKHSMEFDTENLERTLGIRWEIKKDEFTFSRNLKEAPWTKRGILGVVSSIFDPLGFVTPFSLKAKLLLQELWRSDMDWDEEVNDEPATYWKKWLAGAQGITKIRIPRCYKQNESPVYQIQLHVFCDAAETAFGPVGYLRYTYKDGSHESSLVMSKSKLAPIKAVTLPRLELNAAVTAVRMYRLLIHEIDVPVERTYFWTDSTLVLQYIYNKVQRFKTYVANRVTEILEISKDHQWHHVPGELNPADLSTRGLFDPSKLMVPDKHGTSWFTGPAFLKKDEEHWPSTPTLEVVSEADPEIKRKNVLVGLGFTESRFIEYERFSSWIKLKRSVAWLLRFINIIKGEQNVKETELLCKEIDAAQKIIVSNVQQLNFKEEINTILAGRDLPMKNKLSPLCPVIDADGCLRVGGRIQNAAINYDAKHPFILPKNHHVTGILIWHEHKSNGHIGSEHVLANLREAFWIINGRSSIKSVLRKCFYCRVRRAKLMYPFMANLPAARLEYGEPPFTNCGIDLFGPIQVKQLRKRLKRWAVLFTCLTVRCIHLEVVESLDTDSFINSLRRFVNRRGCPRDCYSDCGTNFKGATTELKEFIAVLKTKEKEIKDFASSKNINWNFNPPSTPHMGGAWERLVKSVKEVMTAITKDTVLTDPQLLTLLTEVENIVNSRPLTPASEDINGPRSSYPLSYTTWTTS